MGSYARDMLGFDLRSLAALRIVACSCYLWELLLRWKLLEAFYTDSGLLPRTLVFDNPDHGSSLYLAVGSLAGVRLLFALHLAVVSAVLVGYHTRIASLTAYVLTLSLQNRFPALPGWETEIRTMFLIGAFLPWAERASLDSRRRSRRGGTVVSLATVAWRLQVASVYLVSGLAKIGPGWGDGTGVEVSLASDGYSTPIGRWLLHFCQHHPPSLAVLNDLVPVGEICAPLFLLCPWPVLQMTCVLALWTMHTAFGLCLNIGMFSQLCAACLVGFVPGGVWDRLGWEQGEGARGALHPGENALMTWIIVSIVLASAQSVPEARNFVTEGARAPWAVLGLEQRWGMFVPPPFDGGWHVIKGRTESGEWVDLFHDSRALVEERPEWPYRSYPSVHAYLFMALELRAAAPDRESLHLAIADYYRRIWERDHPSAEDRIAECEILYFKRSYVPGQGFGEAERVAVFSHDFSK